MKFGLALPHYDFSFPDGRPVTFDRVAQVARRAERLGFDSVWISDHFFLSLAKYGAGDAQYGALEPLTTLAGLASRTERIRLGTMVLAAPLRHPSVVAKSATAIDLYSNGRMELGLGAGWFLEEFPAFGYEFGTTGRRFAALEEAVWVVGALLAESPVSLDTRTMHLVEAYNNPRPKQRPRPPVWLGAKGGPRAIRLAARFADGWNTAWRWSYDAYAARSLAANRVCEEEGRDPASLRRQLGLYALVGESEQDLVMRYHELQQWTPGSALGGETLAEYARETLSGTPERILEQVGRFSSLGVEEIVINAGSMPFSIFDLSMLDLFAESVMAPAKSL